MKILKRGQIEQTFDKNKIYKRIKKAAHNLKVDIDLVFEKVIDNLPVHEILIKTIDIDLEICRVSNTFIPLHYDYSYLAGNIGITRLYKETNSSFYDSMMSIESQLDKEFVEKLKILYNYDYKFDTVIDYRNDFKFDYFAFDTLINMYLLKNSKGQLIERPQYMYMRIAIAIVPFDDHLDRFISKINKIYDLLATKSTISLATPIMINIGTSNNQLISCTLIENESDSIEGILNTINDASIYSSKAAGIGLCLSNVRSKKSKISTSGGNAAGILKYVKMVNEHMRFFNQQGRRPGSCAIYIEPWHRDIFDIIHIKSAKGEENTKARDTFLALWCPDIFFESIVNNDDWYLFCPDEIKKAGYPPLDKLFGQEFNTVYFELVSLGLGEKVKAIDLWESITVAMVESGIPYILSKDNVNNKNGQSHFGPIVMSNLCAEIVQYTDSETTAQCCLGSLVLKNLTKVVNDKVVLDVELLKDSTQILVEILNYVLVYNNYPTQKGAKAGIEQAAIGIGVQGLADLFFKMDLCFGSLESKNVNKQLFELIYLSALERSAELYNLKDNVMNRTSPSSMGVFQFDMWGVTPQFVSKEEVSRVREKCKSFSVKNSLLTAVMPTASSAKITDSNESVEPQFNNIFIRKVVGGEYAIISKYLIDDLEKLNLWNEEISSEIILNNGKLKSINFDKYRTLSDVEKNRVLFLKDKYKVIWEIPSKTIIDMAADRAPYIDQSQSMNLYMAEPTFNKITSAIIYGWRKKLKTLCYYLKTKSINSIPTHLAINTITAKKPDNSAFDCFGCSA